MNPRVDILISTCARTSNLEEAVFSALNQDYDNFGVIVLNGRKEQFLSINNDKVKVINMDLEGSTISNNKNILIENSNADILIPLDDDDLLLPFHIKSHVQNIIENDIDVSLAFEAMFWERKAGRLHKKTPYTSNLAFKNKKEIRYIKDKHADFDQHFRNFIISNISYNVIELDTPSYVYCWDNDVFHMCGVGNEVNFRKNTEDRFKMGLEPVGNIEIVPKIRSDVAELLKR